MKPLLFTSLLLASSTFSISAQMLDSFEKEQMTEFNQPRMFLTDQSAGGKTELAHEVKEGVLYVAGSIIPPRGQPGWASTVLPLASLEKHFDASEYNGIELKIKVSVGNLSVSANSTEVTNFDYHAAMVVVANDGQYHTVKVPFSSMQRAWSPQTELNLATLSSISLVAFGLQPEPFDFAVDHIKFY